MLSHNRDITTKYDQISIVFFFININKEIFYYKNLYHHTKDFHIKTNNPLNSTLNKSCLNSFHKPTFNSIIKPLCIINRIGITFSV